MKFILTALLIGSSFWCGAVWHAASRPTQGAQRVSTPLYSPILPPDCLITAQMCKRQKKVQL